MESLTGPSPDLVSPLSNGPLDTPRRAPARLLNFGLFGAALSTGERILPNSRCRLLCTGGGLEIDLTAQVIRSMFRVAADGSPYYEVGLRFDDVLGEAGQRVLVFLVEAGAIGAEDRIAERFSAGEDGRLTIEIAGR